MQLNTQAVDLNRRLFDLCYELGTLSLAAHASIDFEAAQEFADAVAAVKAAQARLEATELVVDAARDAQDQSCARVAQEPDHA